jgi:uncharacterized protein (DUF1015 family)
MKSVDPVMIMYKENSRVKDLIERIVRTQSPLTSSSDGAGLHTIWAVDSLEDTAALELAFSAVEHLYIADGHHRSASAVRRKALACVSSQGGQGHLK